jgi:hypothetical protein
MHSSNCYYAFFKSNTRQTYAEFKLSDEGKALSDEAFNLKFQEKVFDNFKTELHTAIHKALDDKKDYFVCDRSMHDYIGYYLSVFQNTLTIEKINEKQTLLKRSLNQLISSIIEKNVHSEIHVFSMNFPANWSVETESSDGWRKDKTPKNFMWSVTISYLVSIIRNVKTFSLLYETHVFRPSPEGYSDDKEILRIVNGFYEG